MTEEERFSAEGFWKLKKANNAPEQMWSAIIKESGVEVYGEMDVKNAYRKEFMNRLQMTKMDPRLTKYQERTESLYKLYIATAGGNKEADFTYEELEVVVKELKCGKATGDDKLPAEVIIYGGGEIKQLIVEILNNIKNQREIPKQWWNVIIQTIYKRNKKGNKKNLRTAEGSS